MRLNVWKRKKLFTLVELIIVIAILSILSVTTFVVLTKWFNKARDSRRMENINSLNKLVTYYLNEPDHVTFQKAFNTVKANLRKYTNTGGITNGVMSGSHIYTFVFDDKWAYDGLHLDDQLKEIPKDPYTNGYYVMGIVYSWTKNGKNYTLYQIAATREYLVDQPILNTYALGNYKKGDIKDATTYSWIVLAYKYDGSNEANYLCWTNSTGDNHVPYPIITQ